MHRDLKPENLLCEEDDDGEIVIKLTDFGFATRFGEERKETIQVGSPLYMAPELYDQVEHNNKVDIWATGVMTYVLLTGSPPFDGRN